MALNHECLGKTYPEQTLKVEAERTKAYAESYNDDNPWFLDESREGGIVGPPLFGVVYAAPCLGQVLFDSEINADLMRLVHGEQDMHFLQLVKPGDVITSSAKIVSMEEKSSGEFFEVDVDSKNQDGEPILHCRLGFFIRGEKKGEKKPPAEEPPRPPVAYSQAMAVTDDQTYRYAEASGDHNPIHVDDNFAKMAGLGGIILQGLCTMAFTSKAIIDEVLDRDPTRLKRLKVRFSKPVRPNDTVTTTGWETGESEGRKVYGFEVMNQDEQLVIKNGIAEVV